MKHLLIVITLFVASAAPAMAEGFPKSVRQPGRPLSVLVAAATLLSLKTCGRARCEAPANLFAQHAKFERNFH